MKSCRSSVVSFVLKTFASLELFKADSSPLKRFGMTAVSYQPSAE